MGTLRAWFYPDKCIVCGKLVDEQMMMNELVCPLCEMGLLEEQWTDWRENPKGIKIIKSLFFYRGKYKESVLRWKYQGIRKYAKGYGQLMATELIAKNKIVVDVLIPIPISNARFSSRGFNQALDLAEVMSKQTGIPVWDGLERTKNTKPQSSCSKEERHQNIRGTIRCKRDITPLIGKSIAFVDDIYTTGSTVSECMRVITQQIGEDITEAYVFTVCLAV